MSAEAITSISSPYSTKPDTARASHFLVRFDEMASASQGNSAKFKIQTYKFKSYSLKKDEEIIENLYLHFYLA
jgi:hypothetical protein